MLPKVIYSLWATGAGSAPALVSRVFESWARFAPDYEIVILEQADLDRHLEDLGLGHRKLTIQAASDILRTKLLAENGGVWLDATCLLSEPLDNWLPELAAPSGFFAFASPGPDRPLSSWMLAAEKGHPLLETLLTRLVDYWSIDRRVYSTFEGARKWQPIRHMARRKALNDPLWSVSPEGGARHPYAPYFFFHYLFGSLLLEENPVSYAWQRTPKISAVPAHAIGMAEANGDLLSLDPRSVAALLKSSPVHKLNWRKSYPAEIFRHGSYISVPDAA